MLPSCLRVRSPFDVRVLWLVVGAHDAGHVLSSPPKIATVGIYGAKKLVAFANAFVKARKEATGDAAGEVSTATKDDEDDQDEGGDEKAVEVSEPRTTNHIDRFSLFDRAGRSRERERE